MHRRVLPVLRPHAGRRSQGQKPGRPGESERRFGAFVMVDVEMEAWLKELNDEATHVHSKVQLFKEMGKIIE